MTTDLDKSIEQQKIEEARRYPLLDIADNRAEIREIAIKTQEYIRSLNPELAEIKLWEAIPRIVIEFLISCMANLSGEEAKKTGYSGFPVGNLFDIGINYMETPDGVKAGNITPKITCRSEFSFADKDLPFLDDILASDAKILESEGCSGLPAQFIEDRERIKKIALGAYPKLSSEFGIMLMKDEWWIVPLIVMAFFRTTRDYLIEKRNTVDIALKINFADIIEFGITKIKPSGTMSEDDAWVLFIQPQKFFKKEYAKNDALTEA